jgi:chloride channel protein, CIC family
MEERFRNIHPLRWFPEFLELTRRRFRSQGRLLATSVVVGIVAGLGAVLFSSLCNIVVHFTLDSIVGYRADGPANEPRLDWLHETATTFRPLLLLVVPTIGGLLSGFIVFSIAPEAEGHGTDAVIASYHYRDGQIRARVPLVKIVASALTIGTGGSGGREGPIAQIGAGFGSLLANLLHLRPVDRRILLAAGMGAGIAAIFRAPLAGALFAAEIMYRSPEFESEVILPAGLASVVSYCTFGVAFSSWTPLFKTPTLHLTSPYQLLPYLGLAVWLAVLAMLYTRTFYGMTHLFHRWKFPRMLKPAVGAFLTGVVGIALFYGFQRDESVLSVMSFGYGILQEGLSIDTHATLGLAALLFAVAIGKIVTTSLTIGSGGSGGVFGPAMVVGGCGGGALGIVLHHFWPWLVPSPGSYVLLGMAGFFAAAAKTPFSTLVIVSELTGNYEMIVPSLWVCTIAYLLSDEQSLYSWQVESRSKSPVHQGNFLREVLDGLKVSPYIRSGSQTMSLRQDDNFDTVLERFSKDDDLPVLPVVDDEGRLLGIVSLEEVNVALQTPAARPLLLAADLMRTRMTPLLPGQDLRQALELFVENDLMALPVIVSPEDRRVVGIVRRSDITSAYLHKLHGPSGNGDLSAATADQAGDESSSPRVQP